MEKKIILITGSTDGIGKITAKSLAEQGHHIILHGRNRVKTEAVQQEIIQETGNPNISYELADLLDLKQIKPMVDRVMKQHERLDVLINNAGAIFGKERKMNNDGFENTITLNLLAPFLLIKLLLPLLKRSSQGRIINVYSSMHRRSGRPDFEDFQQEKHFRTDRAYGLSKLFLIWITRHLARELKADVNNRITINACHPGAVATNFGQDADKGFFINLIFKLALNVMPKPETGSQTSIYLASSPEMNEISGEFFNAKGKVEKPDDRYYSLENEQKVYDFCTESIQAFQ